MINIEVFGPGCSRCHAAMAAVRQAMMAVGVEATLRHIEDPREMARNRIFFTPAVRIKGEIRSIGRVPKADEIVKWLREVAGAAATGQASPNGGGSDPGGR
jgi:small redox-active disulfide protein 2